MALETQRPVGDTHIELKQALALLQRDPLLAKRKAEEILAVSPDLADAKQVLGTSLRLLGDPLKALSLIAPIAAVKEPSPDLLHEFGLCLGAAGRGADALEVLRKVLQLDPRHAGAWRSLGDQLAAAGDEKGSEDAYARHLELSTSHPELIDAANYLRQGRLAQAERITREVLKKDPLDVVAIRMLAHVGLRVGQFDDAINLLERCLELAPGFHLARQNYAMALARRQRFADALSEIEQLLAAEPNNPNYLLMKGNFLVQSGQHRIALKLYETFLEDYPSQAGAHLNYGHTLKTVGRLEDSIRAYRRSIDLRPTSGEAYWSLATLKTCRFADEDILRMRSQIAPEDGDADDQAHLAFALGKALEDRHQFDESFSFYEMGNMIRGKQHRHDPRANIYNTARQIKVLTDEFFRARRGWGSPAPDPIFIVGLPRAGSTLLEQILASHSQVDGTTELPDIIAMSRKLGNKSRRNPVSDYPEMLTDLSSARVRQLGEDYLASTRVQRRGAPFFIDKMPNNFQHIGLIHLILPHAKIVDARRHPMAGCFSCYKQLFAHGQAFTYDLAHLGYYYRDYLKVMDHWDEVLPGRVHRVQYEKMVADNESEIRRLLEYCGLEFEEQCLRFHETERAVRTPSSEQVRKPIYREGLEQWRNYEKHLEPLKKALGPVLERYPI
ncbi:MAG TPA: sulfotransferase [Woeseiaceae bacterium]|nr:sulfotransferase [Woeseiaceae bacterium]